jgi:exonuclease VII small subunit
MRRSSEVSHAAVSTLLDRGQGPAAPILLRDAFKAIFEKLGGLAENMDLISELADYRERVVARLTGQRADHLATARDAHAASFAACRVALNERNRLVIELNGATSYAQAIQFEPLAAAQSALANVEGAKPPRELFPTPEELQSWWQNVERERAKLAAVQGRYNTQMAVAARLQRELTAAQAELDKLQGQEQALSARAENRASHNQFGIETPPPLQEL